jgi:TfoX/Sxy family transcriptional regulator of competence genes
VIKYNKSITYLDNLGGINLKWKKVSTELSMLLANALEGKPVQKRIMFGCPAYFVNNNMFTAMHQDNIVIRLSEDGRTEISAKYDESEPFEPMKGRVMKEYIVIPETLYNDPDEFDFWLNQSYEYASSIPPKKKKTKKK